MKISKTRNPHVDERRLRVKGELLRELDARGYPLGPDQYAIVRDGANALPVQLRVDQVGGGSYLVVSWGPVTAREHQEIGGGRQSVTEPRGGFEVEDLAAQIIAWAEPLLARRTRDGERNARVAATQDLVRRLNGEHGVDETAAVYLECSPTGALRLRVAAALDEQTARRFLALAHEAGLIGSR